MTDIEKKVITVGDKVTCITSHRLMCKGLKLCIGMSGYVIEVGQSNNKVLVDFEPVDNKNEWWINPKNLVVEQFSNRNNLV